MESAHDLRTRVLVEKRKGKKKVKDFLKGFHRELLKMLASPHKVALKTRIQRVQANLRMLAQMVVAEELPKRHTAIIREINRLVAPNLEATGFATYKGKHVQWRISVTRISTGDEVCSVYIPLTVRKAPYITTWKGDKKYTKKDFEAAIRTRPTEETFFT